MDFPPVSTSGSFKIDGLSLLTLSDSIRLTGGCIPKGAPAVGPRDRGVLHHWPSLSTMWGPQDSVQLVYNSNNFGLWYANNYTVVTGAYKPTSNWGASYCTSAMRRSKFTDGSFVPRGLSWTTTFSPPKSDLSAFGFSSVPRDSK